MRLQKAIAQAGITSRRKAVNLIESGLVEVNGKIITEKGFKVDAEKDRIVVLGKPVTFEKRYIYILLNKPKDCISTAQDTHLRKTVLSLVGKGVGRIYPVGRLDKDTTGLLLLTNDGELAFRLMHPKYGVKKVYEATVKGCISPEKIDRLKKGIIVEGKKAKFLKADLLFKGTDKSRLRIHLGQGIKRQIRMMMAYAGHPVIELKRIKFGSLPMGDLKTGQSRFLTDAEISSLKKSAGL